MYLEYFGLKEASFSITPDPHYLYLSQRHQEALAHLLYGTGEGGGFVLLTGEVGTGKTTICRAFLEQLPEHVDLALILNPAVSVPELLQAVCDEFGVAVPEGDATPKPLVDRLNDYLLKAHADGRRPVLMIDEAQNLQPEVLEQIRLLTNLETHKHKLLQIFLVGQPELRELLGRHDLRQLAQRITARYHLTPLNLAETGEYVRHRLAVAGVERQLFTAAALWRIYRLSGGVPRLVNILCDRALLGAFATHRQQVDWLIVSRAHRELQGGAHTTQKRRAVRPKFLAASALVLAVGPLWLAYDWLDQDQSRSGPSAAVSATTPEALPKQTSPLQPVAEKDPETLAALPPSSSAPQPADKPPADQPPSYQPRPGEQQPLANFMMDQTTAFALLLRHWGVEVLLNSATAPCSLVEANALRCRQGGGGWEQLEFYNRPALIELVGATGGSYVLVTGLDTGRVTLANGNREGTFSKSFITDNGWSGEFLFIWRPAPGTRSIVDADSPAVAVRWLKQALGRLPGVPLEEPESDRFDETLPEQIAAFQREQGLEADGVVGPETLIQLNSAVGGSDIPRLRTQR